MACCNKPKIPKDQQIIADKIRQQGLNTPPNIYSSTKSNRSRPGTIAKSCPRCGTKTIAYTCPACSTIIV